MIRSSRAPAPGPRPRPRPPEDRSASRLRMLEPALPHVAASAHAGGHGGEPYRETGPRSSPKPQASSFLKATGGSRTPNLQITSQALFQLSYGGLAVHSLRLPSAASNRSMSLTDDTARVDSP